MTRVMVTGASGFLGQHLVNALLDQGFSVRGTVRSDVSARKTQAAIDAWRGTPSPVEFSIADLDSDAGWADAVAGCDYVLHAASPFPSKPPKHVDDLIRPARDGTLRVLRAAKDAGVRRVVVTSSLAAAAYSRRKGVIDENDWTDLAWKVPTPYYRSKTVAERAAWDFASNNGLDMVTVLPGFMAGPIIGDDVGTSAHAIRLLMTGAFPGTPRIGLSVVDVRDVARAHVLALVTPEASGQRILATGRFMWFREVAAVLRANYPERARKIPKADLPDFVVRIVALFDGAVALIVSQLGHSFTVSTAKAKTLLGWTPRTEEEAIIATAESLLEKGLV
jgi:nucleoside-diphosphate-sugar epimerase